MIINCNVEELKKLFVELFGEVRGDLDKLVRDVDIFEECQVVVNVQELVVKLVEFFEKKLFFIFLDKNKVDVEISSFDGEIDKNVQGICE